MEIEINTNRINEHLRKTTSYLVLYLIAGLLGELFINYFFIGTNLVSALLTLYPMFLFILFAWNIFLLLLYALSMFSKGGESR